jgi:hypothetical protein
MLAELGLAEQRSGQAVSEGRTRLALGSPQASHTLQS